MFLCRSANPLGRAVTARGLCSLQVPAANRLRDVTVTLHKVHRLHTSRVLCVTASKGHVTNANTVKGQEGDSCLHQEWGWTRGFAADWQHWDRIATIATSLSKSSQAGHLLSSSTGSVFRLHVTRKVAGGDVCSGGHFSPHLSSRSMQTRTASSSAATKQREASDEQQPRSEGDKGDEQVLNNLPPSTEKDSVNPAPDPEGGKPNKTQQLKKVFKEYGAVGVSFHVCISLMSLGMFYLLVSSGIDMAALLCKMGFSETVVKSKMAAGTSTFVLAYAVHKLFAPVRISVTLVSVPLIVRHFRKIGLFKAPPAAP